MKLHLSKKQKKILSSHSCFRWSRREVMAIGLKSFALASAGSLFPLQRLFAQDGMPHLPGFLVLDLVGGAALPGNFLVGGKGGSEDLLSSYSTLGFDPRNSTMDSRFGLPAPQGTSQFFEGLTETMSSEAQDRFRMTAIAHQAVDDSNNNTTSALGLVTKYWDSKLKSRPKGFGSQGTNSGGRTRLSLDEPALRPLPLNDVRQLNLLKGLGYLNNEGLTDAEIVELLKFQESRTIEALAQLSDQDSAIENKFKEHFDSIHESLTSNMDVDPRNTNEIRNLFGLPGNARTTDESVLTAGIILASIRGLTGPSCVALGGYDYHDGSQSTGDRMDRMAGQTLGRTIELAHRLGKPLFVQILTDGSCSARNGTRNWNADSGQRTLTLMGCYHPDGVNQTKTQIGHFTEGQIAESETFVGRRTDNVAQTVFANYLSSIGAENETEKFADIPASRLDDLLSFT